MKSSTLKYFVGKVCTVFTSPINRQFTDQQFNDYFVGLIESVNEDGIIAVHSITGCKNFYSLSSLVALCEEQVLDPSKPEEAKLIQEFKNSGPYAEIDIMADLARQAKELEKKNGRKS